MDDENARRSARNSLLQASAALEIAYQRMQELRQSIRHLADVMPPSFDLPANPNASSVGPPHEAILLSGQNIEEQGDSLNLDMARLRSSISPLALEGLERFESERTSELSAIDQPPDQLIPPPAPSGGITRQLPPSRILAQGSFVPPHRNPVISPRRSLLESQFSRRRDVNPDDPSTALGRRVAAREAGEVVDPVIPPQLERFILNTTAVFARNLENITTRFVQRTQTADSIPLQRADQAPPSGRQTPVDPHVRRSLEANGNRAPRSPSVGTAQLPSNIPPFQPRPVLNRRWRMSRPDFGGRQSSGSSGQSTANPRLSVLSNFSAVETFPSPVTPLSREAPILFEEPISYVAPNTVGEMAFEEEPEVSTVDRNYVVHRRVNADGDEFVHNLNMQWNDSDDDRATWLTPPHPRETIPFFRSSARGPTGEVYYRTELNTSATTLSSATVDPPRRRRGWARLDADGNEISTDEEEELERIRAENRVRRSVQLLRASSSAQTEPASETTAVPSSVASPMPTVRSAETGNPDVSRLRVHGHNSRSSTAILDSLLTAERYRRFPGTSPSAHLSGNAATSESQETFGSPVPFVADPLPMPLAMMTPSCNTDCKEPAPIRIVSRQASRAGH